MTQEGALGELQKNAARGCAAALDAKACVPGISGHTLVSTSRLRMTDVVIYERNLRRAADERINLKEPIRVIGINRMLTVTRRPRMRVGQLEFLYCDFLYVGGS